MRKNYYRITFEWKVTHNEKGFFRTGKSSIIVKKKNRLEAINSTISYAENIPSWEFKFNGIDIKRFEEDCIIKYTTQLTKIVSIVVIEGVE